MIAQGSQASMQFSRATLQSHGQGWHEVVTPSQVTEPRWPTEQFWSTLEQVLLPPQLMPPPEPQLAEAVQMDLFEPTAGRLAVGTGAGALARLARKA
ncbi:MAG TPA: hypothetical protein VGM86_15420 [Thermoanaerobaculia bacterium]|jgi:hypothetical protein